MGRGTKKVPRSAEKQRAKVTRAGKKKRDVGKEKNRREREGAPECNWKIGGANREENRTVFHRS